MPSLLLLSAFGVALMGASRLLPSAVRKLFARNSNDADKPRKRCAENIAVTEVANDHGILALLSDISSKRVSLFHCPLEILGEESP